MILHSFLLYRIRMSKASFDPTNLYRNRVFGDCGIKKKYGIISYIYITCNFVKGDTDV